jgi:hypothetical protein
MSSVVISGDTSGAITLAAPAVAGTATLTLPTTSGNVVADSATQTLTNKSIVATQLTGTIAGARLPAGTVLQVVQSFISGKASTTSTSLTKLATSASITPSSSTSKILVSIFTPIGNDGTGNAEFYIVRTVSASDTTVASGTNRYGTLAYDQPSWAWALLDSPATTSAITYSVSGLRSDGTATPFCGGRATDGAYNTGTMFILQEIAA